MEQKLLIRVEIPHPVKVGHFKELYRNILTYEDGVIIPFTSLYAGLRLLYPQVNTIISFSVTK